MPDNDKPDAAPDNSGQPNQQQLEAIVARAIEGINATLDRRISGLMSVYDRKFAEMQDRDDEPSGEDDTASRRSSMSPSEKRLARREAELRERELTFSKKQIALELDVPEDEISGTSEEQLRISALTYRLNHPTKVEESKTEESEPKPTPKPVVGKSNTKSSPSDGEETSGREMILQGLRSGYKWDAPSE